MRMFRRLTITFLRKGILQTFGLALLVAGLSAGGFGCGSKGGEIATKADQDAGIFRLNLSAQVSSLDPAFADNQANTWAVVQLFNGLLRYGSDGQLEGDLALRWSASEDGKIHTFFLRKNAWFHADPAFADSARVANADDVVFSFRRLLDPALGADGFWVFNGVFRPQDVVALNDSTVQITLLKPFQPFLSRLTMPYCSVLPPEVVEHYGADFRNHPVGTGPFLLAEWKEGEKLRLSRHPRYFGRDQSGAPLPYLEGVQFSFMSAKGTEFLKFRNGELDFVSDLDAEFLDQVLSENGELNPAYEGQMLLQRGPYFNTEYLGINLEAAAGTPLADRRVRQALSWGIDRRRMIDFQRNGKGIPAEAGMVPPSLLAGESETGRPAGYGYRYDPNRASALLTEAGFPGGRGLPEVVLRTNDQYMDICLFLQAQWKELGIPVRVENMDGKILRESMVTGQSVFFRASWIADYPDAESYLALFLGEYGAPPNYTRTRIPAFDALYHRAAAEPDRTRRLALYRSMDSLVATEAAAIPLYYDEVLLLTRPGVTGVELNALNLLRLEQVRKSRP